MRGMAVCSGQAENLRLAGVGCDALLRGALRVPGCVLSRASDGSADLAFAERVTLVVGTTDERLARARWDPRH